MSIWFLGFVTVIVCSIVYAGMKTDELLYRDKRWSFEKAGERYWCGNKTVGYVIVTISIAIGWFFVIPAVGLFMIGKKIGKRNG